MTVRLVEWMASDCLVGRALDYRFRGLRFEYQFGLILSLFLPVPILYVILLLALDFYALFS